MINLNEEFKMLDELIKKVNDIITSPIDYEYDLKWLMKQDNRNSLFERNPKCFLKLRYMGREIPFFPICNRTGYIDKNLIDLSIKMVNRLVGNNNIEQNQLVVIASKLNFIKNRYDKEIPKPMDVATQKSKITKFIKNLSNLRQ